MRGRIPPLLFSVDGLNVGIFGVERDFPGVLDLNQRDEVERRNLFLPIGVTRADENMAQFLILDFLFR